MLNNLATLLGVTVPIALFIALWVLAQISRRYGEVIHKPPIYRGYYVAGVLMIFPLLVRLLAIGLSGTEREAWGGNSVEALLHNLPLALSITLTVFIAWRYWGWLIYAREGQIPISSKSKRSE